MSASVAEALRIACRANNLGTSGSAYTLLKRLAGKPEKKKEKTKSEPKSTWVCKGGVCEKVDNKKPKKPTKMARIKITGNGKRMSASYYFHEVCDGNIKKCKPQLIQEPSGRKCLKKIKIVNGAHGKHPRWVLC